MAVKTRSDLKSFFQTGDLPNQGNFEDLIDSFVHLTEGDDNEGQIKNTLHISSSENYISGSAPGVDYVTPDNEDFNSRNIETRTAFNSLGQANESDPVDVGKDQNDFFTSSISPTSGSLPALFDRNLSNEFGTILYYGPTGSHTGSIEFSGDTADGALSDYIETGFHLFSTSRGINLLSDVNVHDGFVVSYWVKPLETGSLGNPMIAIGKGLMKDFYNPSLGNPGNNEHFAFGIHGPNIFFNVGDTIISSSAHGMEIDRWYHWIIRGEGGSGAEGLQAWRNGEEVFSGSYESTNSLTGRFPIYYGGRNSGSKGADSSLPHGDDTYTDGWACKLSEVAIFNRSKSISDLWDGSGNPVDLSGTFTETSASGLVLYHKLNEADIQEDGTIKDYGPYDFTASIGTGVSSLNWSNDAAGPNSVSIDFYHRGHSFPPSTGESRLTNAIEVQFIKGFEAQQIQISGSNNGGNSFDPLYGDTENVFHGQSNDYGFNLAPFAYIQADNDLNGLGTAVYRRIRFNTTTVYKHYRITYKNWQNQILKPSELKFGSSSGYFEFGDVIPADSTVPMAIAASGSIIPGDDNTYDLGAPDKIWRHIYVGSGSLNFMSRSFDAVENEFVNEKVSQLTISKSAAGAFLQFKGEKGSDHMDVEFRQVQAGKDPSRGHTLNDAAGPSSTDVYGKMQQYMGGGDGQQLITRPEYTAFSPFGRKFVSHILNAQGRGSLTIGLQNFTGDQKGFFRVEKNTSIAGAGTPLFEVSESGQTILYGTDSELTAEGGVSVQGQFSGSVAAFRGGNTVIEDGVVSQPGTISQSFSIGTLTSPSTTTLTGVGSNCVIRISEDSIVTVNNDSEFQIQCPQPDITANSDTGTITLSDPNVMGGGDVFINPDNGGNPTVLNQSTTIPIGQVSYWTAGSGIPGTYMTAAPYTSVDLTDSKGIQIGDINGVLYNGISINGEEILSSSPNLENKNIQLRIKDGAELHIQPATQVVPVDGGTTIGGTTTFEVQDEGSTVDISGSEGTTLNVSGGDTSLSGVTASLDFSQMSMDISQGGFFGLAVSGSTAAANLANMANFLLPVHISGSTMITGSLTVSGSNSFKNIGPFSNTGNITASGNISASGNIIGNDITTVSASIPGVIVGNPNLLSLGDAEGNINGTRITINNSTATTQLLGNATLDLKGNTINIDNDSGGTAKINLLGNVTASANISSSNNLYSKRAYFYDDESSFLANGTNPILHLKNTNAGTNADTYIKFESTDNGSHYSLGIDTSRNTFVIGSGSYLTQDSSPPFSLKDDKIAINVVGGIPSYTLDVGGDIRSTGIIYTNTISQSGYPYVGITLNNNVTASNNISASGEVAAAKIVHPITILSSSDSVHCGSITGNKFTVQTQLQAAIADGDTSALFTVGNTSINTDSVIYGTLNGTTTLIGGLSQSSLNVHINSNNSMSFCFADGEGGETIADDTPFTASFVVF